MGSKDFPEKMAQKRVDFLALQGEDTLAIIEIKSVDDVLPFDELRRLEDYKNALKASTKKKIVCVLIYGGKSGIDPDSWARYENSPDFIILQWKDIFVKNKDYYEHYRAVLENHIKHPNFQLKAQEIVNTKNMLSKNSVYRSVEDRKLGLGPQDLNNPVE
ncbi:MAG: hypothetical protein JST10_12825 [Bacteroidetes bacterium]|nr:hypothetical protein [Bacteroidota bacterium]